MLGAGQHIRKDRHAVHDARERLLFPQRSHGAEPGAAGTAWRIAALRGRLSAFCAWEPIHQEWGFDLARDTCGGAQRESVPDSRNRSGCMVDEYQSWRSLHLLEFHEQQLARTESLCG